MAVMFLSLWSPLYTTLFYGMVQNIIHLVFQDKRIYIDEIEEANLKYMKCNVL